jgi:hypothetical protein
VSSASQIDLLKVDCPNLNNQQLTSQTGSKFTFTCGFDISNGQVTQENRAIVDIVGIISYSLQDCIDSCAEYSLVSSGRGMVDRCTSVSFCYDMRNITGAHGGNCWLKNGTAAVGSKLPARAFTVSGQLAI